MNILMLSPTFPRPLNKGSRIRIYHSLRVLSREHHITLLSLLHDEPEAEHRQNVASICDDVRTVSGIRGRTHAAIRALLTGEPYRVAKFHFESYRRALHTLLEDRDFDLLWVHFLNMLSFLKEERFDARVILDQHNADQLMWRKLAENASMFHSLFARMNISMLQEFRATHTSLVDRVLSVSEEDASFTRSQYQPEVEVDVVPNGVDLTQFSTSGEVEMTDPVRLLFCGSMDVQMNVDAVRRFARDVFPDLRDRLNKVRFDIVGRDPVPEVISLADHTGVNVTGTVDDVLPYYRRADVMVAPFQYGGGTKLKILEALAARVPVVSTEVGVQGIDVRDGQHVLVARKLSSFADQVTELTDHPGLRRRLVENGYDLVAEKYSWDSIYGNALTGITKRKSKS